MYAMKAQKEKKPHTPQLKPRPQLIPRRKANQKQKVTHNEHDGVLLRATHNVRVLDIATLPIRMSIAHHGDQRRRGHSGKPHLKELTNCAANLHLQTLHSNPRFYLKIDCCAVFSQSPTPRAPSPTATFAWRTERERRKVLTNRPRRERRALWKRSAPQHWSH